MGDRQSYIVIYRHKKVKIGSIFENILKFLRKNLKFSSSKLFEKIRKLSIQFFLKNTEIFDKILNFFKKTSSNSEIVEKNSEIFEKILKFLIKF